MLNTLTSYWVEATWSEGLYIHPQDIPFFERHRPKDLNHSRIDADTFPSDIAANAPHFFHLSLLPVPYIGDLTSADIFVLMLNPGFSKQEYTVEALPGVKDALLSTLSQDLALADYPFWYLNPTFEQHPGRSYWLKHLKGIGDYQEISRRLAVIQMMPYHSKAFNADKLTQELPSSQIARQYVQHVLVPRAKAGEILLVVARQVRNYGFEPKDASENLLLYSKPESIGAYVSVGSRGGKAVIKWLTRNKG